MLERRLGTTDIRVSALGLGCNNFGVRTDLPAARNIVAAALDAGITLFDTADVYGLRGGSETILGEVLGARRKDIFLVSKFGVAMDDEGKLKGGSARYVASAIEASLKRLKTDWIDLYYYHRPDPATPIEETLRALDALIAQGKVRYIGCSNMSAAQIAEAQRVAQTNGSEPLHRVPGAVHLLSRQIEADVIPARRGASSRADPLFPARQRHVDRENTNSGAPLPPGTRMSHKRYSDRFLNDENFHIVEKLRAFCAARNRSLVELAFGWLLSKPRDRLCDCGGEHAGAGASERGGDRLATERRGNGGSQSSLGQAEGSIGKYLSGKARSRSSSRRHNKQATSCRRKTSCPHSSLRFAPSEPARLLTALVAVAAFATLSLGNARAEYPDHPVTIVACFPAGGGTDLAARMIHVELGKALGQPVIIENRGGAGGSIGTGVVARATPDGYTLLACSSAFVVNPSLYQKVPYDPFKDFTPIMVIGASPNVFVVPAQSKIQSMKELIAQAKANPGKMNWTSPGVGTTPQLAGELLKIKAGLDMQHIPYAGAGPANTAVLGGLVDFYVANYGSLTGLLSSGKVRPIAVTSKTRWPDLKDVPTLDELGIKDAESDTFQGLFAPAGTPKPIVDRLAKEVGKILAEPEMKAKYVKLGLPVVAEGPETFQGPHRARGADVQGSHRQSRPANQKQII